MTVEVKVTSDASTAKSLRVKIDARNDPQLVEDDQVALPYDETFDVALDTPFPLTGTSVEAKPAEGASWISCRVTVDGEVVSENTSDGAGSIAVCEKKLRPGPS